MPDRWAVEQAVRASGLPPAPRVLMYALLTWVDPSTAVIPEKFTPSLTELQGATGLARSTIADWLNHLESTGWVDRNRPSVYDARVRHRRTTYRLTIPRPDSADPPKPDQGGGAGKAGPPGGPDPEAGPVSGPATADNQGRGQPSAGPLSGPDPAPAPAVAARRPTRGRTPAGAAIGVADEVDHPYRPGPNGYCAVRGCKRSQPLHPPGPATPAVDSAGRTS